MPSNASIPAQDEAPATAAWSGMIEHWDARRDGEQAPAPGLILICEHASNAVAHPWEDLGVGPDVLADHVGWDAGALGLARELAARLAGSCGGAELVHAPLSRLIYDLNRSPDRPDAMPDRAERHAIPANRHLPVQARLDRTEKIYLPFHATVHARTARAMALGVRPVILTIHSFTQHWFGTRREVEFGIIQDDDPTLAQAILGAAAGSGLVTRMNEPYSAADHVTHTLRLQALPYRLPNAMLELRRDLIASPSAEAAMADRLAPVLTEAIARTRGDPCRGS